MPSLHKCSGRADPPSRSWPAILQPGEGSLAQPISEPTRGKTRALQEFRFEAARRKLSSCKHGKTWQAEPQTLRRHQIVKNRGRLQEGAITEWIWRETNC